jgi:hypothetical protein
VVQRAGLLLIALVVQVSACGLGDDEVVGIQVSDSGFVEEGAGDTNADGEGDSSRGSETGGQNEDPLNFADPTGALSCAPQPGQGMYSACEIKSDCDATDSCFFWGEGQTLCSRQCFADADCPSIPGCGAKPTCTRDVCTLECSDEEHCPNGMTCTPFPAIGVRICM